ncbi:MAG: hypothetical protein ACT4PM_06300, partial [Gemmatimonadales bacterium]
MRYPILSAVLILAACGKGQEARPAADTTAPAAGAPTAAPAGGATITGMIKFSGTPPANPTIDMSEEAACKGKYTTAPTDPQVVVTGGMLANAFVYVKSG